VCLTFHSGEDGQVKRFLAQGVRAGRWSLCNAKPLQPTRAEVRANPRARSSRLRAAVRCSRTQQGGSA
jgi:16S rRNA (cytosine1402-N4)-methyltransferase